MNARKNGKTQKIAAAQSGFSKRSAHNIEKRGYVEAKPDRNWKTRKDPDDLLDINGEATSLGKPIGSDLSKQKATCLTLFDQEKAEALATSFLNKALEALPRTLPTLETLLLSYSNISYA